MDNESIALVFRDTLAHTDRFLIIMFGFTNEYAGSQFLRSKNTPLGCRQFNTGKHRYTLTVAG